MARVRATGRRNRARRSALAVAPASTDAERQAQLEEALATQMAMQRKLHEQLEVCFVVLRSRFTHHDVGFMSVLHHAVLLHCCGGRSAAYWIAPARLTC